MMNIDHFLVGTDRGYSLEINLKEGQRFHHDKEKILLGEENTSGTMYTILGSSYALTVKRKIWPDGKYISAKTTVISDWDSYIDPANITDMEKGLIRMTGKDISSVDILMIEIGSELSKACINKTSIFELENKVREMLKPLED